MMPIGTINGIIGLTSSVRKRKRVRLLFSLKSSHFRKQSFVSTVNTQNQARYKGKNMFNF